MYVCMGMCRYVYIQLMEGLSFAIIIFFLLIFLSIFVFVFLFVFIMVLILALASLGFPRSPAGWRV